MYVNKTRLIQNSDGGYDVEYSGWDYSRWMPTDGWIRLAVALTENDAKIKCEELLNDR